MGLAFGESDSKAQLQLLQKLLCAGLGPPVEPLWGASVKSMGT